MAGLSIKARGNEWRIVAILCLGWSVVNFDFIGINFLVPFIAPEFGLDNTRIGILLSVFWIPFAASSYLAGRISDRSGRRKAILVGTLIAFSIASVLPAFAKSFGTLLAARLVMGLLEGPILPLAQSVIALDLPSERRALNMGVVQVVGAGIISGFLAPLILVAVGSHYGWRTGFLLVIIPGLVSAGLAAVFLRDVGDAAPTVADPSGQTDSAEGALREGGILSRNVLLCCAASFCFVAHSLIGFGYIPLFLTSVRHVSVQTMGVLMSGLGITSIIIGVVVPAAADRYGRKPVAVVASLLGACCPLAVVFFHGSPVFLGALMMLGWTPIGASILFMGTIPSESVPIRSISTAIGLTFAAGTLVGGAAGPSVAGWVADHWGLSTTLLIEAGAAVAMALCASLLTETRPRQTGRAFAPGNQY